jgi:hypothetical protein
MTAQITRLSGIRQGILLSACFVVALLSYQLWLGLPESRTTQSLLEALLASALLVFAIEERVRSNKISAIFFLLSSLFLFVVAAYVFSRPAV